MDYISVVSYGTESNKFLHWMSDHLTYKIKRLHLWVPSPIRCGVCNNCRRVKGIDIKTTEMHHELYDDADPLRGTIELCQKCHAKYQKEMPDELNTYLQYENLLPEKYK